MIMEAWQQRSIAASQTWPTPFATGQPRARVADRPGPDLQSTGDRVVGPCYFFNSSMIMLCVNKSVKSAEKIGLGSQIPPVSYRIVPSKSSPVLAPSTSEKSRGSVLITSQML
jgi:hypothetical protein